MMLTSAILLRDRVAGSEPQLPTPRVPVTRVPVVQATPSAHFEPLGVSNYHLKFHELLKLEERTHAQLLRERCNGKYSLALLQAGKEPGDLRFANPYHVRCGYFQEMDSEKVSYATQSASAVYIKINGSSIKCDILRMNYHHAEERLYVGFTKESITALFLVGKSHFESPYPLEIKFLLKSSYFHSLKEAIQHIPNDVIARILPNPSSFVSVEVLDDTMFQPFQELCNCSSDQFEALKMIASAPSTGPPVLVSGPFGTGKTRVLAIAAHYFLQQSIQDNTSVRILVCTHQHNSADAYLEMYDALRTQKEQLTIIRLIAEHTKRRKRGYWQHLYKTVEELKNWDYQNCQHLLVITTCLVAKRVSDILPHGFFSHIFLDDGAQMREPEAIAPLCMTTMDTKIVIAGDKYQVGPAMLVLGEVPQEHGLSKSLLERLYDLYYSKEYMHVAKLYYANLRTNFRCHRKILDLACQVAYKEPLHCEVPDESVHPDAKFPLQFVCTSLDFNVQSSKRGINENEVYVALNKASSFLTKWPESVWGKRNPSEMCFLSPCRAQITFAHNAKGLLYPMKSVQKVPTYQIQGQDFRALFISTSEPTKANGETCDSTKSISDPHVFITAITRARSLVVAVGNPFMLLKREEHMVKKYGDRGHCWSLFIKACLDNKSITCSSGWNDSKIKLLTNQVDQRVSYLHLTTFEPLQSTMERDEVVSSINVIPTTPTEVIHPPGTASSTEEAEQTLGHLENHILKEMVGKGGFGVVYIVQNKYDKRECALKIVRMPDEKDKQEKVKQKVQALAKLDHPNIVRYYDSWLEKAPHNWRDTAPWKHLPSSGYLITGDSQKQRSVSESGFAEFAESSLETPFCLFIKTELCDKATLKTWLDNCSVHNWKRDVIDIFMEIVEAVKYIHSKQLIHGDIKPSNIFFSRGVSKRKIKIGDFGLVTTPQVSVSEDAVFQSKYLSTSFYIRPERYDKKVDVWALGSIYFEMNYPFGSHKHRTEVLSALCESRIFPKGFKDNLPHEAAMIESMLSKNPMNRPSAEQIASEVQKLKEDLKRQ